MNDAGGLGFFKLLNDIATFHIILFLKKTNVSSAFDFINKNNSKGLGFLLPYTCAVTHNRAKWL